nr:heparinase II/III family protein [Pseudogemmobacter faecipullorum]
MANRYAARAARRVPGATAFIAPPEPRSIGLYARGKQILAGNLLLAGHLAEAPGVEIWDIPSADPAFIAEAQGYAWLEDLAALGTAPARRLAQDWTRSWIRRYSSGEGPGWTPDLTGRRLIRWIHHGLFLLSGEDKPAQDAFFLALARQTGFLARRAHAARPGLPRFEALIGLLYAALSLRGMEHHSQAAITGLAAECEHQISDSGAIANRNPEELLEILTLLTWAKSGLQDADLPCPPELSEAIDRIAPCLRALRHADGGLARFHGGGTGAEGRLDQALAASQVQPPPGHITLAMGFARLSAGRSSLILDAADPPSQSAPRQAHASTAAFELTSGRRPLVVNCGSGLPFGPDWGLAGRASQSHSTLALSGMSSSRFSLAGSGLLDDYARVSDLHLESENGALVRLSHDGWQASHGLICSRELQLSADGRRLSGTDDLYASTKEGQARMQSQLERAGTAGIAFAIRFHLHPDVDATLDMGGSAVSIELRSGEIWVFRHDGYASLALEPSVYLEKGRLKPRPARQIVLSCQARGFATRIGWTLAKAQDTPLAIRDLDRDEPVPI